jgi:hypothetical protein
MSTWFDKLLIRSGPLVFRSVGEVAAAYKDADGAPVTSLVVSLGEIEEREEVNDRGNRRKIRRRTFGILKTPDSVLFKGLADVHLRGVFTINSEDWSVESISNETAAEIHGVLSQSILVSVAGPGTLK